jgi:hypothetical protein
MPGAHENPFDSSIHRATDQAMICLPGAKWPGATSSGERKTL